MPAISAPLYRLSKPDQAAILALAAASLKAKQAQGSTWQPMTHQLVPEGDWRVWLLMGGRGIGKTDAGAHAMDAHATGPACLTGSVPHRMAIVAPSHDDAVQTCVIGETGIQKANPAISFVPSGQKVQDLRWPNGSVANLFGAFTPEDVERFRGPQHCFMWLDELAAWRKLADVWPMILFGLRLGPNPRAMATTTPKPRQVIKDLVKDPGTVRTFATTDDNPHLNATRRAELYRMFGGTVLGRQELGGELIEEIPGALWARDTIRYKPTPLIHDMVTGLIPNLDRVVVAIDPAATSGENSDETGLIVAGRSEGQGWVLDDLSGRFSPPDWARRAIAAYHQHRADLIVAEANNGGEMVSATIHAVDPHVPVTLVHASRGKITRAQPIATLYREGKVFHVGPFPELEDQMCSYTGDPLEKSPDRMDAMVWAFSDLLAGSSWGQGTWGGRSGAAVA